MTHRVEEDPGLTLTPTAVGYLKSVLAAKPEVRGIRIGVKKAGCSGYEYTLELAYEQRPGELSFLDQGIVLLSDAVLYQKFLKGGTVMDYAQKGVQMGVVFHNPNVEAQCGCGESFQLRDEAEHGSDA